MTKTFVSGFNVHDDLKELTVPELQDLATKDRLHFAVCLLNIEYDLNIGNCIRTAHITGAEKIFIIGNEKIDSRGTVGAHNYTTVIKRKINPNEDLISVFWKTMHEENDEIYIPIFLEKNDTSVPISYEAFNNISFLYKLGFKFCLVLGNEQGGIPKKLMENSLILHIPQRGVIRSLNVASACAIACHEIRNYLENRFG